MLTEDQRRLVEKSVSWLATASSTGEPGVSPKEVFTLVGEDTLVIANIASPNSAKNVRQNPSVCVSCLDIFTQKGVQLRGRASLVTDANEEFPALAAPLKQMVGDRFPFASLFRVVIEHVKPILAPSYLYYPGTTTEEDQIGVPGSRTGCEPRASRARATARDPGRVTHGPGREDRADQRSQGDMARVSGCPAKRTCRDPPDPQSLNRSTCSA